MNLPKINLDSLPDLDTLTGIFGSAGPAFDDSIIVIMTYLYEVMPG